MKANDDAKARESIDNVMKELEPLPKDNAHVVSRSALAIKLEGTILYRQGQLEAARLKFEEAAERAGKVII